MKTRALLIFIWGWIFLIFGGPARGEVINRVLQPGTNSSPWAPMDLNGDGTNDFSFGFQVFCVVSFPDGSNCFTSLVLSGSTNNQVIASNDEAVSLHTGQTISSSPPSGGWVPAGQLTSSETIIGPAVWDENDAGNVTGLATPGRGNYLGVRFLIGSEWHFGWIRFGIKSGISPEPMPLEYAYETVAETPIVISPFPAVSSFAGAPQATFRLRALTQATAYEASGPTTNRTPTNIVATTLFKSKASQSVINSMYLLKLLENSFNTNFPTGAKLIMRGTGPSAFLVTDRSGSNVILDPGSVFGMTEHLGVNSGLQTFVATTTNRITRFSGSDTETFTELATIHYDDSALASGDGSRSVFQVLGTLVRKRAANPGTGGFSDAVSFRGSGAGMIRGTNDVLLDGTVSTTISGGL